MTIKPRALFGLMLCVTVIGGATDAVAQDLTNLGYATGARFPLTDKTWPANAHAAVSITIDVTGGDIEKKRYLTLSPVLSPVLVRGDA